MTAHALPRGPVPVLSPATQSAGSPARMRAMPVRTALRPAGRLLVELRQLVEVPGVGQALHVVDGVVEIEVVVVQAVGGDVELVDRAADGARAGLDTLFMFGCIDPGNTPAPTIDEVKRRVAGPKRFSKSA